VLPWDLWMVIAEEPTLGGGQYLSERSRDQRNLVVQWLNDGTKH